MGAPGPDILLSPKARDLFAYSTECKSRRSIAVYKWLHQREEEGFRPIVFAKANREEPIVIMYAEDFLKLIKRN